VIEYITNPKEYPMVIVDLSAIVIVILLIAFCIWAAKQ
jgi:hypothetical protein